MDAGGIIKKKLYSDGRVKAENMNCTCLIRVNCHLCLLSRTIFNLYQSTGKYTKLKGYR